jgi:predicted nucleic acid-binding protein
VHVYYLWHPNLRDEGDNHVFELAGAGGAEAIVTTNVGDFRSAELRFLVHPRRSRIEITSATRRMMRK